MNNFCFRFQNKDISVLKKREPLCEKNLKKLILISTVFVFSSFLFLKIFFVFNFQTFKIAGDFFKPKSLLVKKTNPKPDYVLPLLVNLQGKTGPKLAKIHVYITLNEKTFLEKFLSKNEQFKKHLLFVLSGQSVKTINKKKQYLENQIHTQFNSFLAEKPIQGIRIQTEMLN